MDRFTEELIKIEDACDMIMSGIRDEKAELRRENDEKMKAYDAEKKQEMEDEILNYREKLENEKEKALDLLLEKEKKTREIMDREFRQKHDLRSDEIVSEILNK